MLETMRLEFHDDLFPQWWEVFDLHVWQGIIPDSETQTAGERALWSKFNKLCRSKGRDIAVGTGRQQFALIKTITLKLFQERPERERESDGACSDGASSGPDGVSTSDSASKLGRGLNRRCWDAAMVQAEVQHGPLPEGKALYTWYAATSDSTCHVARPIKIVKDHITVKHCDIGGKFAPRCCHRDGVRPAEKVRSGYP